jgi:hypothetical protein
MFFRGQLLVLQQCRSIASRRQRGISVSRHACRGMAIYAVGEGWTGAMTRKHVMETVDGHFDEDDDGSIEAFPAAIYPNDDIQQAAAGWGCSAFLDTQGQVQMVGRPHDLMNLLRMNRMPERVRLWANQSLDSSDTTIVGSMISRLIGYASGGDENEAWNAAREYSLIHDWAKLDLSSIGDSQMTHISCSAGFMALIGKTGTLYTMGINNRGQCGTGKVTNNVWTPEPIAGISSSRKLLSAEPEQEEPVVQVALGFQQGYALTKSGRVYSWGKANRGQLARDVDSDQDGLARPILFDGTVAQVASGMHHAALLGSDNQVYIWGKNMAFDTESGKLKDVELPEPVVGLPRNEKVLQIACGSHHTAILLEDGSVYAVGIASDEAVLLSDPVLIVAPGLIEFPLRQFAAHHDRTTIIDNQGQVLQAHLWKDDSLQEFAAFTPGYVDTLLDEGESIEAIHRGWLHTIIVTKSSSH